MASWQEIDRLRKQPAAYRGLAERLLKIFAELTEWECTFLDSISRRGIDEITTRQSQKLLQIRDIQSARKSRSHSNPPDDTELTTRQAEKLFQIRDDYELLTELHGFSVKIILHQCYEARLDLPESAEARIIKMYETSPTSVRRKDARFLIWCARRLYLIEEEFSD
jgi:hypothetical protein